MRLGLPFRLEWVCVGAVRAMVSCLGLCLALSSSAGAADEPVIELHQRLGEGAVQRSAVALTFDACGGDVDTALLQTLIRLNVPATLFVTQRWLVRNPTAAVLIAGQPELFEVENHGARHLPAVLGSRQRVYGMVPVTDLAALQREVQQGAAAVEAASARTPRYFRSAGAVYDAAAMREIEALGYRLAGFSVNADSGATQPAAEVTRRLLAVKPGDVVIAHMNRPKSGTAQGFAQALPQLQQRGLRFVLLAQAQLQRQP